MNTKLAKILKLAGDLTKHELYLVNQTIVSLIKTQQDVDFKKAAINFNKGDIVSFVDSKGIRRVDKTKVDFYLKPFLSLEQ